MKAKPEERVYFFDNCIPRTLAEAMRCMGAPVKHLLEVEGLAADEKDVDWIPIVTANRWVIVTSDRRIVARDYEWAVLQAAGSIAFFLPKSVPRRGRWEQAAFLTKCWPAIVELAEYARPGDCFDVQENGTVKRMDHR